MSVFRPLLLRELYDLKNHFISVLLFWVLMPVILHIFLAIPLSLVIQMDIRYLNWSAGGIWIVTAGITAFLYSANRMRKIHRESSQIDALLKAPLSNLHLLLITVLRGLFYGIGQFIIALIITTSLNNEYLGINGLLVVSFQMFTLILHFAVLGTFLGMILPGRMVFTNVSFLIFLFISFGLGNFIPLGNFPESYLTIIEAIPTTTAFANIKTVIIHTPFNWKGFFFTLMGTIIIFIISLIASHKLFRKF
ncbi:MAG: hypothetical protein QGF57_05590 [Candidatus Marinimicrobia bacterium]|jgi:hypothetical protein|nr:hypothetical protein [Candidatus Neomarinimicrobiota bacterium]